MRWILYLLAAILGLVVIAVAVLLALGGNRGETTLAGSREIGRPPAVVFDWVTEPARLKSWVGWLIDIQTLTPGAEGVGARTVWVMEDRNNNNQRMDIQSEVIRYDADRLLEARLVAPMGFTGTVTYEIEPLDANRSKLTYRATYKYDHWLAKLLEPVISRSARQKLDEDLSRLKTKAEAE